VLSTLSIDVDDVVEDRRRFASCSPTQNYLTTRPTPRASNGCIDGCVKYCTQTPLRGLSTIPYLMVQLVVVPSVLLEPCENIMARSAILSKEMCQKILGNDQVTSDEDLGDGVNGGAHVL
jgi:hypothetical protein